MGSVYFFSDFCSDNMAAAVSKRTMNRALQEKLDQWCELLATALTATGAERGRVVKAFCDIFLPLDLGKEDFLHFWKGLVDDAEWLQPLASELQQCCTGQGGE